MDSVQAFKLKHLIKILEPKRGRHTELVTVYVPQGYDLSKIINHLQQEQSTATNIKSSSTRKNVISALERMIVHLKLYEDTPENGLAIFAGNVAEREGDMDVQVWAVEPPVPLNVRIYRCDKDFKLDPLKEMLTTKNVYGLITMDKRECTVGYLKGNAVIYLNSLTSAVPGKHKTGGQSAARMERLRDEAAKEFYRRISSYVQEQFDLQSIKGILVGGPGFTKNDFVEQAQFSDEFKKKIITVKDLSYTDEYGLRELVDVSEDELASEEIAEDKRILKNFFNKIATEIEMIAYGYEEVKKALEYNAVEELLLSEAIDEDTIEELEEMGENTGAKVHIISPDFAEGVQLKNMSGIGAILRFQIS